jgi:hypothetical protein
VLVFPSPKFQADEAQLLEPETELVNETASGDDPDDGEFDAV